jgi:hypothetical protein
MDTAANYPTARLDFIGAGIVPGHGLMVQMLVLMPQKDGVPLPGPLQVLMTEDQAKLHIKFVEDALKDYRRLTREMSAVQIDEVKGVRRYL